MANLNTGTALFGHTGFRLASISKTFTALAVMQLYQKQQLALNDSVLLYLPELPTSWQTDKRLLCETLSFLALGRKTLIFFAAQPSTFNLQPSNRSIRASASIKSASLIDNTKRQ
jgi:hypothetical protein